MHDPWVFFILRDDNAISSTHWTFWETPTIIPSCLSNTCALAIPQDQKRKKNATECVSQGHDLRESFRPYRILRTLSSTWFLRSILHNSHKTALGMTSQCQMLKQHYFCLIWALIGYLTIQNYLENWKLLLRYYTVLKEHNHSRGRVRVATDCTYLDGFGLSWQSTNMKIMEHAGGSPYL